MFKKFNRLIHFDFVLETQFKRFNLKLYFYFKVFNKKIAIQNVGQFKKLKFKLLNPQHLKF